MNKSIKPFFALCAMYLLATGIAFADPAFIITDGACGMADENFNFYSTNDVRQVVTSSRNGNVSLKCRIKGLGNSSGAEIIYNTANTGGAPCSSLDRALTTYDWEEVIDVDGNAVLSCKFRFQD